MLTFERLKNRIVLAKDQGFQRLWGNGSKSSQSQMINSSSARSPQVTEKDEIKSQAVDDASKAIKGAAQPEKLGTSQTSQHNVRFSEEDKHKVLMNTASDTAAIEARGNPKEGPFDGGNSTFLSIAPTHDDLRGLTPTDAYSAHHHAYSSNELYGIESPADRVLPTFYAEWRQALRELNAASTALDESRQDFSRFNRCRQQRILNAINITREERRAVSKVV